MSLPAIIKKSTFLSNSTPTQKAMVLVPAAIVGVWLLPWWITGSAVVYAGYKGFQKLNGR